MLFAVTMDVRIPPDMDSELAADLKAREKRFAQKLQHEDKWRHLWRVVGEYRNISIFDVDSSTELHDLLSALPLFPYMKINVVPLCRHPSSIREDDK